MGALWSSCTRTVSPFLRTNFVYLTSGMGMLTLLAAACAAGFAFGAAACWAFRRREPVLTTIDVRSRPAILLINLVLKVPPCEKIEPVRTAAKTAGRRNTGFQSTQGFVPQLLACVLSIRFSAKDETGSLQMSGGLRS